MSAILLLYLSSFINSASKKVSIVSASVSETLNVKLPPGKWLQVANGSKVDLRGFRISEGYVKIQATSGSVYIRV